MYKLLNVYDDYYGLNIQEGFAISLLNDHDNWSTVDLDAPYTQCTNCDMSLEFDDTSISQLCQQCSQNMYYHFIVRVNLNKMMHNHNCMKITEISIIRNRVYNLDYNNIHHNIPSHYIL